MFSNLTLLYLVCWLPSFVFTKDWSGTFVPYVGNTKFCTDCAVYGTQNKCGFICCGGAGGEANPCSSDVCSSGQYTFTKENGWQINTTLAQAKGHTPYRAFAYLPFCYGESISSCWGSGDHSFTFDLMTKDMSGWGIYVKLFFWTDSGNIIGLLPPGAIGAKQHNPPVTTYSIIAFPDSDYPNNFKGQIAIVDETWYHIECKFSGTSVTLNVNQTTVATSTISAVGTTDNGPQLGMYGFDFSGSVHSSVSTGIFMKNLMLDGKHLL